jgi:hypothetical protein
MKASNLIDSRNAVLRAIGNSRSEPTAWREITLLAHSERRSGPTDYPALTSAAIQGPRPPHAIYSRRWRRIAPLPTWAVSRQAPAGMRTVFVVASQSCPLL